MGYGGSVPVSSPSPTDHMAQQNCVYMSTTRVDWRDFWVEQGFTPVLLGKPEAGKNWKNPAECGYDSTGWNKRASDWMSPAITPWWDDKILDTHGLGVLCGVSSTRPDTQLVGIDFDKFFDDKGKEMSRDAFVEAIGDEYYSVLSRKGVHIYGVIDSSVRLEQKTGLTAVLHGFTVQYDIRCSGKGQLVSPNTPWVDGSAKGEYTPGALMLKAFTNGWSVDVLPEHLMSLLVVNTMADGAPVHFGAVGDFVYDTKVKASKDVRSYVVENIMNMEKVAVGRHDAILAVAKKVMQWLRHKNPGVISDSDKAMSIGYAICAYYKDNKIVQMPGAREVTDNEVRDCVRYAYAYMLDFVRQLNDAGVVDDDIVTFQMAQKTVPADSFLGKYVAQRLDEFEESKREAEEQIMMVSTGSEAQAINQMIEVLEEVIADENATVDEKTQAAIQKDQLEMDKEDMSKGLVVHRTEEVADMGWSDETMGVYKTYTGYLRALYPHIFYLESAKSWCVYNADKGTWRGGIGDMFVENFIKSQCERDGVSKLREEVLFKWKKHFQLFKLASARNDGLRASEEYWGSGGSMRKLTDFKFNCRNGVVDVRRGTLEEHNPIYEFRHMSSVIWRGSNRATWAGGEAEWDALSAEWDTVVRSFCSGSPEFPIDEPEVLKRIAWIQQMFGYCLTGDKRMIKTYQIKGAAGTGKSTLIAVLASILGALVLSKDITTLGTAFGVGALDGKYLLWSNEVSDGRIPVALWKNISDGSPIQCNQKHEREYTMYPTNKTIITSNVALGITEGDASVMDRLTMFTLRCPRHRGTAGEDMDLGARLRRPEMKAYVMAWAVQGLQDFEKGGWRTLELDGEMDEITEQLEDGDAVKAFISSPWVKLTGDKADFVTSDAMYAHFIEWQNAVMPLSNGMGSTKFKQRLELLGISKTRAYGTANGSRGYRAVRITKPL